jgi:hypothetical protein
VVYVEDDGYITQHVGNQESSNEWFGRNQWLTASITKQSLACYSVEWVCGPSLGLRVSFPILKGSTFNIGHAVNPA